MTPLQVDFLLASRQAEQQRIVQKEQQQQTLQRRLRVAVGSAIAAGVLFTIALGLGYAANRSRIAAERSTEEAQHLAIVANELRTEAVKSEIAANKLRKTAEASEKKALIAQATAEQAQRDEETANREAHRELGNAYWQRGVSARDFEHHDVRASLLFTASAMAFVNANEPEQVASSLIAAATTDTIRRTFLHDLDVRGALFNSDDSRVSATKLWRRFGLVARCKKLEGEVSVSQIFVPQQYSVNVLAIMWASLVDD